MAAPSNKVKMTVTEMRDADVDYISLVSRSASRLPIRIKKSAEDTSMINLNVITRVLKGIAAPEVTGPTVVAVASMACEGEQLVAIKAALVEQGFAVEDMESLEDGSMVFKQEGYNAEADDQSLIRLSEDMVVVIKGFVPYSDDVQSDFNTNVQASGFFSGVYAGTDALRTCLSSILSDAASPSDAGTQVDALLGQFGAYIGALVKALPSKAFKAETAIAAIRLAAKAETKEIPATTEVAAATEEKPAPDVVIDAKDVVDPAATAPAAAPAAEAAPAAAAAVTEAVKAEPVAANAEFTSALESILKGMTELTTVVKGVSEAQESLRTEVDGIARKAEDATKAVKGTVVSTPAGDEQPPASQALKAEDDDPRTGAFDTAFLRKR